MADDSKKTVNIPVPEGMTAERLLELVQSYEERRVKNKARTEARKKADKALRDKHPDEYAALLKQFMPRE